MRPTKASKLGPRFALSAVLIAASMALVGCGTVRAAPSPTASTPNPIQSTAAGYVFTDTVAGYAVTFPGKPDVEPLAISGTDRLAKLAAYGDPSTIEYASRGEVRDSAPQLRGELFAWLQSVEPSGQIGASSDELAGLDAVRAEFTTTDGLAATTVMASKGKRFYQLIALGGTADERQAFFDTFKLTGA